MFTKRRILKLSFLLPGFIALARLALTIWIIWSNPLALQLKYIQLIPLGILAASCFTFYKMYQDAVPVVSLLVTTIVHGILIFLFFHQIQVVELLPVFVPDVLFLIAKSVKASLFPFYIEGEDDDELDGIEDIAG